MIRVELIADFNIKKLTFSSSHSMPEHHPIPFGTLGGP
jgi:hypothetical protein